MFNRCNYRPILPLTPNLVIETDVSLLGWRAAAKQMRTGDLWSEEERTHHINLLELASGALATKTLTKGRKNIHVFLRMDLLGVLNSIADGESRTLQLSVEWMLERSICRGVIQILGPCSVDLFATHLNNQLRKYISWRPDPFAVATDAFTKS